MQQDYPILLGIFVNYMGDISAFLLPKIFEEGLQTYRCHIFTLSSILHIQTLEVYYDEQYRNFFPFLAPQSGQQTRATPRDC